LTITTLAAAKKPETPLMKEVLDRLGTAQQLGDSFEKSFARNIIILTWTFLCLIMLTLYSANLTSNLTVTQLQGKIDNVQDLRGWATASWSEYQDLLQDEFLLRIVPCPWHGVEDEHKMLEDLESGIISGYATLVVLNGIECDTPIGEIEYYFEDWSAVDDTLLLCLFSIALSRNIN